MEAASQLAGAATARFISSLPLSLVVKLASVPVCVVAKPAAPGWCVFLLDASSLLVRCWLAWRSPSELSTWKWWLTLAPCVFGVGAVVLLFCSGSSDWRPKLEGESSTGTMLLAVSFMLSLLLNRYQGLATRQRVLSAAGHVALGYAFLVDVGTLEAELILLLAVALGMGEAIGSAILLAERAFVSTSITLALEPANNALRLATYRAGELAPTIAWSRVKLLEQIGVGAFGTVFAAEYAGSKVAAKLIHNGKAEPGFLIQECKMMLTLRHPNILTTLGFVSDDMSKHAILMELMASSLSSLLRNDGAHLSWTNPCTAIALQVARGMAYLHERGVIHGDLKPGNVLLGPPPVLHVKLCDFGEAKRIEQTPGANHASSGAPVNTKKGDVWAFGGLLIHLERKEPPFSPAPPMPFLFDVMRGEITPKWPPRINDLVMRTTMVAQFSSAVMSRPNGESIDSGPASPPMQVTFRECVSVLTKCLDELGTRSFGKPLPGPLPNQHEGRMPFLAMGTPSLDAVHPMQASSGAAPIAGGWEERDGDGSSRGACAGLGKGSAEGGARADVPAERSSSHRTDSNAPSVRGEASSAGLLSRRIAIAVSMASASKLRRSSREDEKLAPHSSPTESPSSDLSLQESPRSDMSGGGSRGGSMHNKGSRGNSLHEGTMLGQALLRSSSSIHSMASSDGGSRGSSLHEGTVLGQALLRSVPSAANSEYGSLPGTPPEGSTHSGSAFTRIERRSRGGSAASTMPKYEDMARQSQKASKPHDS